jgi:hypothetical protein
VLIPSTFATAAKPPGGAPSDFQTIAGLDGPVNSEAPQNDFGNEEPRPSLAGVRSF